LVPPAHIGWAEDEPARMEETKHVIGGFPELMADIEGLRRAWDEGKASGSAGPLDMAEIIADAKAEKARGVNS
jgi:hypothetical protein